MSMEAATRDRVIALEVKVDHLTMQLDDAHKKIEEMYSVLMQAKGAKWVILAAAGISGALTSFFVKLLPMFGSFPK